MCVGPSQRLCVHIHSELWVYIIIWYFQIQKFIKRKTKRYSLRPGEKKVGQLCICLCVSVCGEESLLLPRRTGWFIVLQQIREKVQDVIWKKIIAAWPHSFALLGGKENIVPPSTSWNRDRFCRCVEGVFPPSIFSLLPVLLLCSPIRVVVVLFTVSHVFF